MYKLGIDVGGTNTDAVLVDENRAVVADIKYPTSADIYDGILGAMRTVLEVSGVNPAQIHQATRQWTTDRMIWVDPSFQCQNLSWPVKRGMLS